MTDWHFISMSLNDLDHAADIVVATKAGSIRRIPLTVVELGRLVQQAANLINIAIQKDDNAPTT